jgi:hypothetical protein
MALVDIDRQRAPRIREIFSVCRIVGVSPLWIAYRRTNRGWHVILYLRDHLHAAECIAFQACLGSDRRREALNLMRVLAIRRTPISDPFWRTRWNLLYERKLE